MSETDPTAGEWDTYPHCGCQPDDCPDREGVERSAEPDAGDVEALREVLAGSESGNWQAYAALTALAEDILNSDWLDTLRRKAGDERAEEIAQAIDEMRTFAHGNNPISEAHVLGYGTARRLAARIARESR